MKQISEVVYRQEYDHNDNCYIGADIGGTNTNIGIFVVENNQPILLRSLHYKSKEILNFCALFLSVIQHLLELNIIVKEICIAAAGLISEDRNSVKLTNVNISIDIVELKKVLMISKIYLANDFEVIGYGISCLPIEMCIEIKKGHVQKHGNLAILGAGTGLGKCTMIWQQDRLMYIPFASEGGHSDFAAQTKQDFDLIQFIKQDENIQDPISWEDVLSGNGIQRLYRFFYKNDQSESKKECPPVDEIFQSQNESFCAKKTVEYYTILYARASRNFVIDSLATGGLFIVGGIAVHNIPLFKTDLFLNTFVDNGKQKEILLHTPIILLADYNVSLYGAVMYLLKGIK